MAEETNRPESKIIEEGNDQWESATAINDEWRKRAIESFRFYTAIGQWDPDVLAQLKIEERPALTIPYIFPIINLLCGYQRQNRSDITLYPRHGGTLPVARLGTELLKHTMDTCDGQFALSDMFQDGAICAKGWLSAERQFTNDVVHGDLVVVKESPFSIIADQQNNDYDINKGNYVFDTFWWTKREVEIEYPEKAKDLKEAMGRAEYALDVHTGADSTEEAYDDEERMREADEDIRKTHYRIKKRWYKKWEKSVFLVHLPTLNVRRIDKKEHVERAKRAISALPGEFKIIERPGPILYKVVTVGDMKLEHVKDPLDGLVMYPYFRFCPYWVDGYMMGSMDLLKDAQRELNKRRSQELAHLNTSTHSGWIIGAKGNAEAMSNLENFGSKPGVILCRGDYGDHLERIEPAPLSPHRVLAEQAAHDLQNISGVNPSLLEQQPEGKESGRAKMLRQQAGLVVSESIFDNFNRTQRQLGSFLWEIMRRSDVYSEEEIKAVVQRATLKDFMTEDEFGRETIDLSAIRSWSTGRYGVTVSRSPTAPTVRMANFEQLLEAARVFPGAIPPHLIFEQSDLPNKEEIVEYLKQNPMQPEGA